MSKFKIRYEKIDNNLKILDQVHSKIGNRMYEVQFIKNTQSNYFIIKVIEPDLERIYKISDFKKAKRAFVYLYKFHDAVNDYNIRSSPVNKPNWGSIAPTGKEKNKCAINVTLNGLM